MFRSSPVLSELATAHMAETYAQIAAREQFGELALHADALEYADELRSRVLHASRMDSVLATAIAQDSVKIMLEPPTAPVRLDTEQVSVMHNILAVGRQLDRLTAKNDTLQGLVEENRPFSKGIVAICASLAVADTCAIRTNRQWRRHLRTLQTATRQPGRARLMSITDAPAK